jgi:nucleoside-diphosphate-sugar epimerase
MRGRALVTGGAGFIGSHLVDALLQEGWSVRVLDDLSTGRLANLAHAATDVDVLRSDIRVAATARLAMANVDVVFHQAAVSSAPRSFADPATSLEVNALGTLRVLEAARDAGVRRIVIASSSSVYGAQQATPLREDVRPRPISPYGASKLVGEALAETFSQAYGMQVVCLRYFNVYGPRQRIDGSSTALVPSTVRRLLHGERPVVFGDGAQTRDFTFVGDVVAANLLAAGAGSGFGVYNVGSGAARSVSEVVALVAAAMGRRLQPISAPGRSGDVRHTLADLGLSRRELGYEPTARLEDSLAPCVAAYEQDWHAGRPLEETPT